MLVSSVLASSTSSLGEDKVNLFSLLVGSTEHDGRNSVHPISRGRAFWRRLIYPCEREREGGATDNLFRDDLLLVLCTRWRRNRAY